LSEAGASAGLRLLAYEAAVTLMGASLLVSGLTVYCMVQTAGHEPTSAGSQVLVAVWATVTISATEPVMNDLVTVVYEAGSD
jgi:hypothetical protein